MTTVNLKWPRYFVTPSVHLSEVRRHAERVAAYSGQPQLVVFEDGSVEVVGERGNDASEEG